MKRLWIIIGFALLLPGCVSQTVDSEGNPIGKTKLSDELVIDSAGRVIARPTHIYAPDRIVVNGDTPTEREIRLLGVEGLSEDEAPITYQKSQEWLHNYVAGEDEIYIKPAINADLDADIIYGIVYLRARDKKTGEPIPGGYVNVNMAMLSVGLVKIRDLREFEDEGLRQRMQEAQDMAKREKEGLWSKTR
ncbi:MAG: thermonuclease family protein [Planctomycetes bacterium]|nr:thermonuclease family protein [Planctomycetota bacterium]